MEQALYEIRKKIYPRAVTGTFALWRWVFVWGTQLVFYGLPWLPWNGRQAVLFDLGIDGGTSRHVVPGDVIITPGRTPHLWANIESDMSYLVFRPDPDGTLPLK